MKMRMTITSVQEYEPDPTNYAAGVGKTPEEVTAEDVIKLDTEAAEDDPFMFADDANAKTTVLVERID